MKVTPSRALRVLLGVFICGVAIYSFFPGFAPRPNSVAFYLGKDASVTGVIMRHQAGKKSDKVTLERLTVNGEEVLDKVLLYLPAGAKAELGDKVGVHCNLYKPHPFADFQYDRWLAARQIFALCRSSNSPFVLEREAAQGPRVWLGNLHTTAVEYIDASIPDPHAQLLAGLLLGDNAFTDEWKEQFIRTGTSHVVAASGYNVALVSSLAFAFLVYAGLRRQYAFPFVIAAVAGFVIIAGAEAAVTRAGIMGVIGLSATQLGRKSSAKTALLLTAAIMLALEPRLLRDDPGFQLSVLSTMGLMAFAKPIAQKIDWIPERFGIRESFACTLAATLATLPISIFSFHRVSLVGPLTNLIILPFVPYAMATGTIGVLSQAVLNSLDLRSLPNLLAFPGWLLLEIILDVIQAMANLPFAVLNL
ncbi:MAG: ComEC/Rec2 family competence protein [Patescibacteria group bacterium]|jgi:competence protein ComEC